jgi:hypothetical protein
MAAKGYDDSPPRNGIIFFYTVLTVFFLIGVKLLLDSYFANMMNAEKYEKVYSRGMEEVLAVRAKERATLEKGSLPIADAKKLLALRGRGASPLIAPNSGQGQEAIAGWSQLKREVPALKPVAPAPAPDLTVPEATP